MKAVVITLGIIAILGIALLVTVLLLAAGVQRRRMEADSGIAHAEGKSNYIAEADSKLALLEADLKAWRESSGSGADLTAFEKARLTAYDTTDRNIKSGQNPLAYLDAPASGSGKTPGMIEFEYLACDGGPHLVLPSELSKQWKGAGSPLAVLNPLSDYRRACDAVTNQHMALITVGSGQAMVLADPPLSAWGRSPEGWIDIYYLDGWSDTDTDAMVKRAVAATPTSAMTDSGKMMTLTKPGLILLFAGDKPGNTAYGEFSIPIDPGAYRILEGRYKNGNTEELQIYRLQPASK